MSGKPTTIDEYLAAVNGERRAALGKVRRTIRAIIPRAEQCISYRISAHARARARRLRESPRTDRRYSSTSSSTGSPACARNARQRAPISFSYPDSDGT
jgi:hypothetical protein